jgi:hypothetical protein
MRRHRRLFFDDRALRKAPTCDRIGKSVKGGRPDRRGDDLDAVDVGYPASRENIFARLAPLGKGAALSCWKISLPAANGALAALHSARSRWWARRKPRPMNQPTQPSG